VNAYVSHHNIMYKHQQIVSLTYTCSDSAEPKP